MKISNLLSNLTSKVIHINKILLTKISLIRNRSKQYKKYNKELYNMYNNNTIKYNKQINCARIIIIQNYWKFLVDNLLHYYYYYNFVLIFYNR